MDNLKIQLTPLEVTYQSKDPLSLICRFKKMNIANNHPSEKHQIKSSVQMEVGKVRFTDGPTFALSKQFQLNSTKICMQFISKKERDISCIGSTEIDLALLPNKPYSVVEFKLDNCKDPRARLKLQVNRREENIQMKKGKQKIDQMGLLQTQAIQRQQVVQSRKVHPNLPTAYEISRRNYKQSEINCRVDQKNQQRSHGSSSRGSKGSYQKKFQTLNTTINQPKTSRTKQNPRSAIQSPKPRDRTPEPICIDNSKKSLKNPSVTSKYTISGRSSMTQKEQKSQMRMSQEQQREQPSVLKIMPQQQQYLQQNNGDISNNSCKVQQNQKNNKYFGITSKLQNVHDKITKDFKSVKNSELSMKNNMDLSPTQLIYGFNDASQTDSQLFSDNQNSVKQSLTQSKQIFSSNMQSYSEAPHSFNIPINYIEVKEQGKLDTRKILQNSKSSLELSEEKKEENVLQIREDSKFANINSCNPKIRSHETSPHSQSSQQQTINSNQKMLKSQINQLQKQNKQLSRQNEQLVEIIDKSGKQIFELRGQFNKQTRKIDQKDNRIAVLIQQLDEARELLSEKQSLLTKMTDQYQHKFQECQILKEENNKLTEKVDISDKQSHQSYSQVNRINQTARLHQNQLMLTKKRLIEVENQLKMRQNQIKHFQLQIDNMKREKKNLQMEVDALSQKSSKEITRQRSIAQIQQTNSTITQNTKRQNQALKMEIKCLQQKLQSLNALFQTLIHPQDKPQQRSNSIVQQSDQKHQQRIKCLQQRCELLQKQLMGKKNLMAEIVNIIWNQGDPTLMDEIDTLMSQEI